METGTCGVAPHRSVSAVLGNTADHGWQARLRGASIDLLTLSATEAQRARLRKRTAAGADVAVALERGVHLRDGDVLEWDEASNTALVVRADLPDVMVVDLSALLSGPAGTLLAACVAVGHALGNQHWPAVVKESRLYVPVTMTPEVMASVLKAHRIEGVGYWFVPGAQVRDQLTPGEAGLLFTGLAGHSHRPAGAAHGETR
jgi:urease accessory protein